MLKNTGRICLFQTKVLLWMGCFFDPCGLISEGNITRIVSRRSNQQTNPTTLRYWNHNYTVDVGSKTESDNTRDSANKSQPTALFEVGQPQTSKSANRMHWTINFVAVQSIKSHWQFLPILSTLAGIFLPHQTHITRYTRQQPGHGLSTDRFSNRLHLQPRQGGTLPPTNRIVSWLNEHSADPKWSPVFRARRWHVRRWTLVSCWGGWWQRLQKRFKTLCFLVMLAGN